MSRLTLILLIALLTQTACELYPQDEYREFYVVESYLVANRALPEVRLSRTVPLEEQYSVQEAGISNANIEMYLLGENESIERTYTYLNDPNNANSFYRTVSRDRVIPGRSYRLQITFPNNSDTVRATTIVPGDFQTVGTVVDSVVYQSSEQITVSTTQSAFPGRQTYFVFSVIGIEPTEENLTPFYRDQVFDQDEDIEDFEINSSGIINEGNYDINSDGTLTLRVPWLAVAFYGDNDIVANTIDDNLYDFIRSQEVQTGGGPSILPPGEIQNIIYNVEGGIGIFGSLASDTNRVFIKRISESKNVKLAN
ncbi:MAG: DUF4249 family protein [Candidatus Halalkalibacterium sp. M3_1C_030]